MDAFEFGFFSCPILKSYFSFRSLILKCDSRRACGSLL
jgi:hypothetical protein